MEPIVEQSAEDTNPLEDDEPLEVTQSSTVKDEKKAE